MKLTIRTKRARFALLVALAGTGALPIACSSSPTPTSSPVPTSTGTSTAKPPGSDAGVDADLADSSARDSAPSDATADAKPDTTAPPFEPPDGVYQCPSTAAWVDTGALGGISPTPTFLSVSADELTAMWVIDDGSGKGTVYFADRENNTAAFSNISIVPGALGSFELDQVAVSPNGLAFVAVRPGRSTFVAAERPSRAEAFTEAAYLVSQLNGSNPLGDKEAGADNHEFRSPVMAYDGNTLVYNDIAADGMGSGVYVAPLSTTNGFTFSGMFPDATLRSTGGKHRLPTGMAPDRRTIFFFDEVSGSQKVAWRINSGAPYAQVTDLGVRRFASPNANCKRLHHLNTADGNNGQPRFSVAP